jgi:DeoR family suf operon transcriptional repressor
MGGLASAGHPPTREAALALLVRQGECTAAELAIQLEVSVQVMRRHLRSLEEEGLVESTPAPEGPGRPSNHWRLTETGRAHFPDGSEHFALGLLQSLAASLPADTLQLLLRRQAIEKAEVYRRQIGDGPLPHRLTRLVELRRREGYMAECRTDSGNEAASGNSPDDVLPVAGAWVLSEYHCSVIRIAQEFPVVCDQEIQLLRHTFADCQVERVHWRLQEGHSCGFRITPLQAPDPGHPEATRHPH